jgi:two-component sensor histidine kinase
MKAQPHPSQKLRLATLRQYEILDTPREKDFDEIVQLASEICETPISVINLIDEHRQWFKAETGLGTRETPLATSICSHVILESDYVEIPDTLSDPRTADNELCQAQDGLRFYAGYLLKPENGLPLGTLCVLDTKPRQLTDFQKRSLAVLARRVMRELDLRRALRDQAVLRNEMDHRVKNSLQTVASFVRVYHGQLKKGEMEASTVLDAVARRIEAMSALHAALHRSSDGRQVELGGYIEELVDYLRDSVPERVTIDVEIVPVSILSSTAGSIGMIISEFVANSVKHGFPDGRKGLVEVSLTTDADGVHIHCRDNGVGAKSGEPGPAAECERPSRGSGLGTRLVASAASQIGATLKRSSDENGYKLQLTVPTELDDTKSVARQLAD